MSLVINGIDFDKRCDNAKQLLHDAIDWRAQCLGLAVYFKVKLLEEKKDHSFIDRMKELMNHQYKIDMPLETEEEKRVRIEAYRKEVTKYCERYLSLQPPSIQFELIRIK